METERACIGGKEWYFYSQRDRKYATGLRTNRATVSGYWKATGKDRAVVRRGSLVGMRKTLVFYQGRAPKGTKTQWVMHEFRLEGPFGPPKLSPPSKEDWVLCRVFLKNKDGHTKSGNDNDSNNNSVDEARGSSSSSIPPLTDSYITFDQTQQNANANANNYQQVPCFSIFSANQDNPTNNIIYPQNYNMEPNNNNNNNNNAKNNNNKSRPTNNMGGSIMGENDNNGLGSSDLSPVACDKKVLEAVLSHLTKMEAINGSPSLGEAVSSESYLSEVGLQQPTLWTHF
ncbi:hypothetical protein KSS87_019875 [Heliosperma pusillum]|nr:hypothetical protein KSS87_019875 [Heliosperma pusillum]